MDYGHREDQGNTEEPPERTQAGRVLEQLCQDDRGYQNAQGDEHVSFENKSIVVLTAEPPQEPTSNALSLIENHKSRVPVYCGSRTGSRIL